MAKSMFGSCLVKRRFKSSQKEKLQSITEFNNIDTLFDKKSVRDNIIDMDNHLSFPIRHPHRNIAKEEYKNVESGFFNSWKEHHKNKYFERNIEIWRQFWISAERCDSIVQVVDCRCLDLFLNYDIVREYSNKKHIILLNKCDLLNIQPGRIDIKTRNVHVKPEEYNICNGMSYIYHKLSQLPENVDCYFINNSYSVTDILLSYQEKAFTFVGFPNAGKSSTINNIFNCKKVKVSKTPGKTKHLQSLYINNDKIVFDTPGLVFPSDKNILLLFGIINIDAAMNIKAFFEYLLEKLDVSVLVDFYKLDFCNDSRHSLVNNFYEAFRNKIYCDEGRMVKIIVKDFVDGMIQCKKGKTELKRDHSWFLNK